MKVEAINDMTTMCVLNTLLKKSSANRKEGTIAGVCKTIGTIVAMNRRVYYVYITNEPLRSACISQWTHRGSVLLGS